MDWLEDLVIGGRLLRRLPAFLRETVGPEQARAFLRERLAQRETAFLAVLKRAVYEHPGSPYRRLLRWAGCEYGDVERLVTRHGVEGALGHLFRAGVYLTGDELKGRRPVLRGSLVFTVEPARLRNPTATGHLAGYSTGSRGVRTPVRLDLAHVRDQAADLCLDIEARGDTRSTHAVWGVPGAWTMSLLLRLACCGLRPARWFSQVDPAAPGLHPRYRWSARGLRWGSRLAGRPLPAPEHVPVEASLPIARWMAAVLEAGGTPQLWTHPSSAARLCSAATAAGVALDGARFSVSGEPATPARLAVVRQAGARIVPRYGASDCGQIGFGCLAPAAPDEVHWLSDLHALVQPSGRGPAFDAGGPGAGPGTLFMSSLAPTARTILLNASLGDRAVVTRRRCGCPLEALGWTTHLHTIRSDEKVTAGGMNFADLELARALEEVLPARFGGSPTHYQLLEDEGPVGEPRLWLLVHPAVGLLDEDRVREVFLDAIAPGSGVERVMGLAWREAGVLRVQRRAPVPAANGKILHVHVDWGAAARARA